MEARSASDHSAFSLLQQQDASGMQERSTSQFAASDADLYARFFRVLSDPTRVRLLHLLLEASASGYTVGELVAAIGAPQGRVSTHLGCLRWCGLVQPYRQGKYVYYRIADPRVREILVLGGAVMREHAAGVASCGVIR
jgi:DNA-binding transcriptional ArsR family regulator